MKMAIIRGTLVLAAALSAAAGHAQTRASGPVLASELVFEDRGDNRWGLWTADPLLARHPAILRALRAEGVRAARLPASDCSASLPCNRIVKVEQLYAGTRLLSALTSTSQFTGGAHGAYGVSDRIYDLRSNRRVPFSDLFTNWRMAKPLIQAKVCQALRAIRPELAACPDVTEIAFALAEASEIPVGGRATGFHFRTSDYQLGSYADGTEEGYITLDATLMNLIRVDYRVDFRLPAN